MAPWLNEAPFSSPVPSPPINQFEIGLGADEALRTKQKASRLQHTSRSFATSASNGGNGHSIKLPKGITKGVNSRRHRTPPHARL